MKSLLIHGTSKKNYNIGLDAKKLSVWNASNYDEYMYFWDLNKIKESDETEENIYYALNQAINSALVHACSNNDKKIVLIIKKYEIGNENVENDDSCPNMIYASCIHNDYLEDFETLKIELKNPLNEFYRYLFNRFLIDNEYFDENMVNDEYLTILKEISNLEFSSIDETMYEKINELTEEVKNKIKKFIES